VAVQKKSMKVTSKRTTTSAPVTERKSAAEVRQENEKLLTENQRLKNGAFCYMCGRHLVKDRFYVSTDPRIQSGVCPICKDCARKIAHRIDVNGDEHEPTKESVIEALRYLDKPFIESVWNASIQESANLTAGKTKSTPWMAYAKNIQMVNYVGLTFKDSDMFKVHIKYDDEKTEQELVEEHSGQDTYDSFLKNKADVIRLLDYDPFEREPVSDQPFLYSQLLGMLDASEDANEDMMRVSSAIQIVRGFLQLQKIDDAIAKLMGNVNQLQDNSATIKSLQDSKQKITSMITNLAAESCLSLKNSKSKTKGEDTWSGHIRKLKELNLRESEINGFDIETSRAMRQVMDLSHRSILQELKLDESEWSSMVADQRDMIYKTKKELSRYKEISRILLRENLDLKDFIEDNSIEYKKNLVDLNKLFFVDEQNEENSEDG
jgi:hypothetical protein